MTAHQSGLFLAHLGLVLMSEVPDSAQRERIVSSLCSMVAPADRVMLRTTAGLPNKADPWVERAADMAERYHERGM